MRFVVPALVLGICLACTSAPPVSQAGGNAPNTAVQELHEGQVVEGVPCLRDDLPVNHFHVHVGIFLDDEAISVPAGIGVGRPWGTTSDGFITTGSCFAWIHTHDASGVVHLFTQVGKSDVLGQLFSVWGQPLAKDSALGYHGPVAVLVNGRAFDGDPRSVPLTNFENIVLELGKPPATPPPALYDFGTMRR